MKNLKKILAALLATATIFSLTACGDKGKDESSKKELNSADAKTLDEVAAQMLKKKDLANKEIVWLSNWDINPDESGKDVPIELYLFESYYGGKVRYENVSWTERYTKLASMVATDEAPDFFPGGDMDGFPSGAISGMFAPLDDYIDYESDLWKPVKELNDQFMVNGKHYVGAVAATDGTVVIYNKSTVAEYCSEDPAALLAEGKWDWNAFKDMLEEYCDATEGRYGIDGFWTEASLLKTTGVPLISMKDGKISNNIMDPNIERVQQFMKELFDQGYVLPKSEFNWNEQPQFLGEGKELFYPCGLWALYNADLSKFGEIEDIMFVPMPKDPQADKYYLPGGLDSFLLVSGGKNPEGVAAFLDCKRVAVESAEAQAIGEKQLRDSFKWTDEMVEMKNTVVEMTQEAPVYDFYTSVSSDVTTILDSNAVRQPMQFGDDWSQIRETYATVLQTLIDKENAKIS